MSVDYGTMNGVQVRNALTTETDLSVLLRLSGDKRTIVREKAQARIRQLGDTRTAAPASDTQAAAPTAGRPAHRPPEPVRTERRRNLPKAAPKPTAERTDDTPKICPKCGDEHPIGTGFGWRLTAKADGKTVKIPQPWCRTCRNGASRESAERKKLDPARVRARKERERKAAERRLLKSSALITGTVPE